ncbi:MAG: division plane positioning ATPase MipZ [Pseudomonadota bacterium]
MSHVIVVGNEKGGSGKSTTAMHVVIALCRAERSVGVIDLDLRQKSLTRYLENRTAYMEEKGVGLPMPALRTVAASALDSKKQAEAEETDRLQAALISLKDCDFIVLDCPGSDTHLSRRGHAHADTILTPMNDSFVDFDLLARIDPETDKVIGPSVYAEMVWEARKRRALTGSRQGIDWVVMRNRLSATNARNKVKVGKKLEELAKRIGFRFAHGFGERVIYRELFPLGLTLLDLGGRGSPVKLTMSHVTAKHEVRRLIKALELPGETVQGKAA